MSDSPSLWALEKSVPSVAENGIAVITEVVDQLRVNAWEEHDLFGIHMALEEAIMNAIKHGNEANPEKVVVRSYSGRKN